MTPTKLRLIPPRPARNAASPAAENTPVHPFDALHNTETGGLIPGKDLHTGSPADRFITAYYAVAPSILNNLLEIWQHTTRPPYPLERYTFLDLGAGKGRAVIVAAKNPFHEVLGVELNPTLVSVCLQNIQKAQLRSEPLTSICILEADALTLRLPATPTLVYLFHPFEAPAMRRLLRAISAQFAARPGQLDLLYVNSEHSLVLDRDPAFTRVWQGRVPMSIEDHLADLKEIANQAEYGSTGDELCAIYRFTGRSPRSDRTRPKGKVPPS